MAPRNIAMIIKDANELDIFDDVPLKYLKNARDIEGYEFNILDCNAGETWIRVKISVEDPQERNREGLEIMVVTYEFGLNYNCNFTLSRRFTWLSPYGRQLNKVLCGDESDEDDSDDEDDEDIYEETDEEEEPTSVIDF